MNLDIIRTGRFPGNAKNEFYFDLTHEMSDELKNKMKETNCIIFNAYQTLEGDHDIWNTSLETFDEKLALERFTVNCFGYVKILQQLIKIRKEMIKEKIKLQDMIVIFMDANESKFDKKLQDGKHLELNMAKTACKQIFYTNAQILAEVGIISICYDPGWLSYHGISVSKIQSKSKFLIPPELSAKGLLCYIQSIELGEHYKNKMYIHDMSFYNLLKI